MKSSSLSRLRGKHVASLPSRGGRCIWQPGARGRAYRAALAGSGEKAAAGAH